MSEARSLEGRGLSMKAQERWVDIQKHTFLNWVNLQLQGSGMTVTDPEADFDDGVRLCALVESLQNKKIGRVIKKPMNHHQNLENVTLALNAIAEDNVRLVNIGSEDIVNGSTKLILGLVWRLILRYQIGKTKIPPKKLILAWLKAVIPECAISNFTSDWNDGVALHALVDYCQPGLCPNWRQLSRHSRLENCKEGMQIAKEQLNIPIVVRPEDFSSSHLDDLSGMTYLSYFMMVDAPGYLATRREIRALLQEGSIENFTTDWNDGRLLASLVTSVGGTPPVVTSDPVETLQSGIDSARQLGIEPIFSAREIADPEVEHLGVMAYAAYFRKFEPVKRKVNSARMQGEFDDVMVRQEKTFYVTADEGTDHSVIRAELSGPDANVPVDVDWTGNRAHCSFTPTETGHHKLNVLCEEKPVPGCPVTFKVLSDRSKVHFEPLDKAIVGYNSELIVDTTAAGEGEVRMEAESPTGKVLNLPVMYKNGIHMANFTPSEVGDWKMSMIYEGDHVTGSPYTLPVIDPSLVQVTDIEDGKVGQEAAFNVDASLAGNGELRCEVFHDGWTVPCPIRQTEPGKYRASFMPQSTGTYKIHIYFSDIEVRGSPQELEVVDTTRVYVTGDGLSLVPVNTPAVFTVHTEGAGGGKVDVDITAPSGYKVPWNIKRLNKNTYKVDYRVTQPGEYTINVQFGGQEVTKTPFVTKAYDTKRMMVSNMPVVASRDKPVQFSIDASQAGSGNIEIRVNEGRVPCNVENKGNHRFSASFMPENSRPHAIEMSFNEMPVEGSPWSVDIVDKNNISVTGDEWVQVHRSASATIVTNGQKVSRSDLKVHVTGPEGERVSSSLTNEHDGNCSVQYIPTSIGNYDISVKYGGDEVADSPFTAKAYNTGAILVTPIKDGYVNQPMFFTIDVGDAGEGQLQIMVNNGNIRNDVEPQEQGTYKIKFVPVEVGRQEVVIKFNDHDVPNSPLVCMALDMTANVIGLKPLIPVMEESSFSIQSQSPVADVNTDVSITGPSGQKVPVRMKHTGDRRTLDMEYMPREVGTHLVNIAFNGHHIKGSPFQIKTFDPDQVKVSKVKQGIVGVPCKFKVDASDAGDGTLEIAVTNGGHIVPNSAQPLGNNCYEISFLGEREGPHKVSVTYNGIHAQGSPYNVPMLDVSDMQIVGDDWDLVKCHQPGQFSIRHGQGNAGDLHVKISGPGGSTVPSRVIDKGNGTARIDWTPNQIGTHKVYVDYGGIPIKGSPFSIRVFDASMVSVSKINSGLVNKPVNFTLDASEAGEGNLEILVMCDNEVVPNYVTQEGQTKFRVNFTPKRAGLHVIHMQFNGESLRGSPHNCQVFDPESVYVSGDGVNMAPANQQTSFMVNMKNAGDAKLNVKVVAPRGDEIPVHFSGNPKTGIKIDYTPYEVGVYKVYVDCGGVPVSGSPFSCNVFDQSLIRINAPGRAYLGKPIRFHVDASAAGEGNLKFQVKCHGSEVPVRIQETARDRYDVTFTPQRSMTHHVLVFYNNIQVPGTPFDVPVIDGNSVTLSGDGPRLAKIYKEARINLEHQGLDERDLDVHVVGPSGSQIPARIARHGKLFGIEFTPMEVGVHRVIVNVGDSPVNGSPFKCNVYDPSAVRIIEIDKTPTKEREIGFTIDSGSAGTGDLEVMVSHKGQPVPAKCRQIGEGRYTYSFKPLNVGRYEVKATFNGETIPGSPLIIDVEEDHPTFIRINMSSSEPINTQGKNYFLLHMNGRNVERDMLNIIVLAPNGEKINARLIQQPDGDYKVEWTPNNPGRHSVDVLYGGQQIQGSPFYIDVFDIHKIRVNNFYCGNVGEKAGFRIDCTQAGSGDQEIRVQSPTGRIVPHHIEETAHLDYNVSYTPVEVGTHQVFISYSGMELNGDRHRIVGLNDRDVSVQLYSETVAGMTVAYRGCLDKRGQILNVNTLTLGGRLDLF